MTKDQMSLLLSIVMAFHVMLKVIFTVTGLLH